MSENNNLLPPASELRKPARRMPSGLTIAFTLSLMFLLGCAAWAGFLIPQRAASPTVKASANTYTQLIPDDYGTPVSLTLTAPEESFTLICEQDTFRISGEDAALDPHAARELLTTGASIISRRTLTGDPADYGIDNQALRADYTYPDGQTLSLRLGHQVPTGEGWYAAIEGDPRIHIVNNALQRTLSLGKQGLYALPALSAHYSAQTLSAVTFEFPGEAPLTIARMTKANPFNTMVELRSPIHYPANSERAAEVYLALEDIRLTGLASPNGADETWGLDQPLVLMTLQDEEETRLHIGMAADQYTLRINDEPAVYTVDAATLSFLNSLSVPWLAEQLPGLVMLSQVAEITVTAGDHSLHFTADQSAHTYTLDGNDLPEEAFLPAYQQIIGLLIERYVPQTEEEHPPRLTIAYTLRDGSTWSLALCEYDKDYDLIRRDGCACFLISRSKTDALLQTLLSLRTATP